MENPSLWRKEADGIHFEILETPVFGLFNTCMPTNAVFDNEQLDSSLFVYNFNKNKYLYRTELEAFFDFIKGMLSVEKQKIFQNDYVNGFYTRNRECIMNAMYSFEIGNLIIALYGDVFSPSVPCPMMQVVHKK